jgi:hypothetical protein
MLFPYRGATRAERATEKMAVEQYEVLVDRVAETDVCIPSRQVLQPKSIDAIGDVARQTHAALLSARPKIAPHKAARLAVDHARALLCSIENASAEDRAARNRFDLGVGRIYMDRITSNGDVEAATYFAGDAHGLAGKRPAGLSPWAGWDTSRAPWSQAKHKDAVCAAVFGPTWSMEDAHELISFIERTWGNAPAPTAPETTAAETPVDQTNIDAVAWAEHEKQEAEETDRRMRLAIAAHGAQGGAA